VFHARFAAVASTAQWMDAVKAGAAIACDNIAASNRRARAAAAALA